MKFLVLLALAAIAVAIPPEKIEADLNQLFVDVGALESATKASAGPTPPKRATKASAGPTPPKRATKASAGPTPPKTEPVDDWGRPLYFFPARDGSKKTEFLYTEYQLTGTNRGRLSDPDETINGGRSILIGGSARKITRAVAVGGGGTRKTPMIYRPVAGRAVLEEEETMDVLVQGDQDNDHLASMIDNHYPKECRIFPVVDQEGQTCWAHATAGALQRRLCLAKGEDRAKGIFFWPSPLIPKDATLSGGQIVSCVDPTADTMSKGGSPLHAYRYARDKFVSMEPPWAPASFKVSDCARNEAPCYPTEIWSCHFGKISLDDATSGWVRGEREMRRAIYEGGPITSIMWLPRSFHRFDGKGVYVPTDQDQEEIRLKKADTHVVQVVGWGVETNEYQVNVPYWVIVNTWGLIYDTMAAKRRVTSPSSLATGKMITLAVRSCTSRIVRVRDDDGSDAGPEKNFEYGSQRIPIRLFSMKKEAGGEWGWLKPFTIQVNSNEPDGFIEYLINNNFNSQISNTFKTLSFKNAVIKLHVLLNRGGRLTHDSDGLFRDPSKGFLSPSKLKEAQDLEKDQSGNPIIYVEAQPFGAGSGDASVYEPTVKIHRGLHSFWKNGEPSDALGLEYNPSFFGGVRIREDAKSPKLTIAEVLKSYYAKLNSPQKK